MAAHVLVFPCPAQGHINCMLHFAAGLLDAGLHVTFLHSDHNLRRLGLAAAGAEANSPRLRFLSVPDGLPDDHPRSAGKLVEFMESMQTNTSVAYRALLPWVLRPDMVGASQNAILQEAVKAVGGSKARVVEWAPQRDVLRHRAVGCFLTHAGWNSTLEVVTEGVPTVCWPFFTDQQTNSRFIGAVWGTGLDMKDVCERAVVGRMVREAMESEEIRRSAQMLALEVRRDIAEGGSSTKEFKRLVGFIKELSLSTIETPTITDNE